MLLQDIATLNESIFIVITETHLDEYVISAEIDRVNYDLFRSDPASRKCGGVAMYVKQGYGNSEEKTFSNSVCDSLIVKLEKLKTIETCYRPPNCSWQPFQELIQFMLQNLFNLNQNEYKIIINGDFNFSNILWFKSD
jgi:hypothetical protein